jgi:hypothetical protein
MLDSSLTSMPIPCVDVVLEKKANVLLGFRAIRPYRKGCNFRERVKEILSLERG